jgi:hypothetical protein
MVRTLQAKDVNLLQLEQNFGLTRSQSQPLFAAGTIALPTLTPAEQASIQEIQLEFNHLSTQNILEPIVKMVVLAPLLRIAGFFLPPFTITAEQQIELLTEDEGLLIRGLIDILVLNSSMWVVTIEAKRAEYSLKAALPQVLAYMLSSQTTQPNLYGLITNGGEFRFVQLTKQPKPTYALSDLFSIDRGTDLQQVAQILKAVGRML